MSPLLALVGFVGLCVLVGASADALIATAARAWYPSLVRPFATPPLWVFGPIWTALYVLAGIAGWLAWRRCGAARPLRLWGWQTAAAALWTPAFFGLHSPPLGIAVAAVLLVLTGFTIHSFFRLRRAAAWLLLPFFVWAVFAAYLDIGFWWLNRI